MQLRTGGAEAPRGPAPRVKSPKWASSARRGKVKHALPNWAECDMAQATSAMGLPEEKRASNPK